MRASRLAAPAVLSVVLLATATTHAQPQTSPPPQQGVAPIAADAAPAPEPEVGAPADAPPPPQAPEAPVAPPPPAPPPAPEPPPAPAEPDATATALDALEAFHWSGYLQAQYEMHADSDDEVSGTTLLNLDRFLIRRGRLKLKYEGIEHARFVMELDGNSTGVSLKEGTAALIEPWTGWDFELALGLFKTPFGYETLISHSDFVFPEASALSTTLWPGERDVGLRLTGKHDIFRFQLALVNGDPIGEKAFPGRDPNTFKDLVGRLGLGLPLFDIGVSGQVGTEFQAGTPAVAASTTWLDANGDAIVDPEEVTNTEAAPGAPSQNATRWRLGFDAQLHTDIEGLGKLEVLAEVAYAHRAETDLAGEQRLAAGYLAVIQHWQDRAGIAFRVAMIDPDLGANAKDDQRIVLTPVLLFYPVPAVRMSLVYDIQLEQGANRVANDIFTARMQVKF